MMPPEQKTLNGDGPPKRVTPQKSRPAPGGGRGRAQLTLVEHALCPLDSSAALREGLIHQTEFLYVDANRHQRKASAKVVCPFGLSPGDEFYLWGLIALTLFQSEPSVEFYATPHYCLTALGLIARPGTQTATTTARAGGGKTYALFRQAITRLSTVTYISDRFYDPVRGEHRDVAFGFLSYSLPADPTSSRAWRFVWDPMFFEFCQAARGSLAFDLETYRSLDFASRRLFLLLKKIFWRQPQSPAFDVQHLGVNLLGFAPSLDIRDLKVKIGRCAERLEAQGIVAPADGALGTNVKGRFEKKGVGAYVVRFRRGPYFDVPAVGFSACNIASPLVEPLRAIGFDDGGIARILTKYNSQLIQVWSDITLAAKERSPGFFKVSPQAYFMDNAEQAARGLRTPPDWWHEHRKEEERRERESKRQILELPDAPETLANEDRSFEDYLQGEGRAAFAEILGRLMRARRDQQHPVRESDRMTIEIARTHLRNRFRREHPEHVPSGPTALGELLKNTKIR